MMKRFFLALLFSLSTILAHASGEILTYEKFVHLSDAQKDQVIIKTMEMMAEMESQYSKGPGPRTSFIKLQNFFMNDAYAAPLKTWKDYAREYTTLLKKPNSLQCVYAGWVSQVIKGDCVQPSTLPHSAPEYKTYIGAGGVTGTATISCNPVIFGFKQEKAGSLFSVPAGKSRGNAHNSSFNCMKKALESSEGDIPADRLEFLRKQLSQNPAIVNDVYKFLNQACLCPEAVPGLNSKYHEYMVPHRTCYGLMNMIAETVLCEAPNKSEIMDVTFFKELKNFSVATDVNGDAFDSHYAKFLKDLRLNKSSEIAALCKKLANGEEIPDLIVGNGVAAGATSGATSGASGGATSGTTSGATGGALGGSTSGSSGGVTSGISAGTASGATSGATSGASGGTTSGGPGLIVKDDIPVSTPTVPVTTTAGSNPGLSTLPKFDDPGLVTTPTPITSPEEDIVVIGNKCFADCKVPVGKKGDKSTPMVCTPRMKNPTPLVLLDKSVTTPQTFANGAPVTWIPVKFERDEIDDNDKPIKEIRTEECIVSVVESNDPIGSGPSCTASCTFPTGKKDDPLAKLTCNLSGKNKDKPLTFLESVFKDVDPKLTSLPGVFKDDANKDQKIDCPVVDKKEEDAGPSCTAKCTYPTGKKDDAATKMTCALSGNLKADEPLKFITSSVEADKKSTSVPAKYKDGDEVEKEIQCKVEGPTEAAAKPTVSIKNTANLPTTSKFEATMKGADGKEGKPEGWTLVWTRKRDKDLKLTKSKVKPEAPTKASDIENKYGDSGETPDSDKPESPETKIPDGALDVDKEKSEQPRAAKDYDICATLVKGEESSAPACLVVPKIKVGNVQQPGNGQQQQPQTPPGAMRAGGVQ